MDTHQVHLNEGDILYLQLVVRDGKLEATFLSVNGVQFEQPEVAGELLGGAASKRPTLRAV